MSVIFGAVCAASSIPVLWWTLATNKSSAGQSGLVSHNPTDLRDIVLARGASQRVVRPGLNRLAGWAQAVLPRAFVERLEQKITLAGVGNAWPIGRVLAVKVVLGIGGILLLGAGWLSNPEVSKNLMYQLLLAVGSFMLPDQLIGIKGKKRQEEIGRTLPDVIDHITISVEAGLGFNAALNHVARRVEGPLAVELKHTMQDIKVGMSRTQAFENLIKRTDVPDVRAFVVALRQAEKMGVPIAEVLRSQASELRVIRRQKAEETAQKLPVKLIIPLIVFILPALVIVVLAPAVIDALEAF